MRPSHRFSAGFQCLICVWCIAVSGCFFALWKYAATPGAESTVASLWPDESMLPVAPHQPNLIVFIHPACPCTKATLAHLHSIVSRHSLNVQIVKMRPLVASSPFEKDAERNRDILDTLCKHPSVSLVDDVGSMEAQRFGAKTSGVCFLYDQSGQLLFSGGITASRGHQGMNAGLASLIENLDLTERPTERSFEKSHYPVFGCPL